jgi:hypothetical protein
VVVEDANAVLGGELLKRVLDNKTPSLVDTIWSTETVSPGLVAAKTL